MVVEKYTGLKLKGAERFTLNMIFNKNDTQILSFMNDDSYWIMPMVYWKR